MNPTSDGPARLEPTEFTREALLSAATALGGGIGQFRDWGAGIFDAVGSLADHRGRPRVDHLLLEIFKSAAEFRHQAITPFQGMLEAPSEIIAVYQTHKAALSDLTSMHSEVMTAVLSDLATTVMDQLDGTSWPELEALGADQHSPPQPAFDEDDF